MRHSGQNVIVSLTTSLLRSGVKVSYFLTYLKLRRYVVQKGTYGSFVVDDELTSMLGLSLRTVKKHIAYCLKQGWIRSMTGKSALFQIVSMTDLAQVSTNHAQVAFLSDEQLFSITSQNAATLKAIFAEFESERYIRYKEYLKRKAETQGEWSHRDHCRVKKQPNRKKSNGPQKGEPVTHFACGLSSSLTGVSRATAHRYRDRTRLRLGNPASLPIAYENSKRKLLNRVVGVSDWVTGWNEDKEEAIRYFANGDADSPLGQEILYGRFLICRDGVYLRAAAKRIGRIELRRIRIGRRLAEGAQVNAA